MIKHVGFTKEGFPLIALSQIGFLGETDFEMGIGMQDAY